MARQTSVLKLKIPSGTTKRDFEEAFEGVAQGPLKEELGSVGSAAAPVLKGIIWQTVEEKSKAWLSGRNCFLLTISDLGKKQVEESYKKFCESPTPGYTGYVITWRGDLYPGKVRDVILSHYEKHGIKPEEIRKCNRIGIFVHGSSARASIFGGLGRPHIRAEELFDGVEPFLEPNGELWLFICGGEQEEWDEVVAESDRPFRVVVFPGEGRDCDFDRDMERFIDPLLGW